jgi:predicted aspartyl protease
MQATIATGRIDDQGKVLLPVIVIASDGVEIEVEASVNLEFDGYLAVNQELAKSLGWRRLGARRVLVGFETRVLDHYIGTVALGGEPKNVVVLGGIHKVAVIGQRLLSGHKFTVDFSRAEVTLTAE